MKKLFASALIIATSLSVFAKKETKSSYTDLKDDCIVVSEATDQAEIDFYTSECKAYGGFSLKESGGDLRYGPELSFNGQEIPLQLPGRFHNMGSQKIEWVYDLTQNEAGAGSINFKALIFRINEATDDGGKDVSSLYVVRLNGEKSCVIGKVPTNEAARALANDKAAKCVVFTDF